MPGYRTVTKTVVDLHVKTHPGHCWFGHYTNSVGCRRQSGGYTLAQAAPLFTAAATPAASGRLDLKPRHKVGDRLAAG